MADSGIILVTLVLLQITCGVTSLRCLQCQAAIQPRHCRTTRICEHHEVCIVEQYRNTNGVTLYNVGCGPPDICSPSSTIPTTPDQSAQLCRECCQGDLCNAAGCGEQGYPSPRGPVCLDCVQMTNPDLCDTIAVCSEDSLCHLEEENEFGDTFYHTRCLQKSVCDSRYPPHNHPGFLFGDSSTIICSHCCHGDLCNSQCNTADTTTTATTPTTTPTTTMAPPLKDNTGTSFLLLFPPHSQDGLPVTIQLKISARVATVVTIEFLYNNTTTTHNIASPGGLIRFNDHLDHITATDGVENKGALLTADHPITLAVYKVSDCCEGEAYTPLPTQQLGKDYVIANMPPHSHRKGFVSFAALEDNTVLHFVFHLTGSTFPSGIVLKRLQVYTINSDEDFTGTRVTSDKPFGVVSGQRCSGIAGIANYCNHMTEYLYPVCLWGTEFIAPTMLPSAGGYLLVVTTGVRTTVTTHDNSAPVTVEIDRFAHINVHLHFGLTISSSHPILVVMFAALDAPTKDGYPLMVQVPPRSMHTNTVSFNAGNAFTMADQITLIARTQDIHTLLLDGFAIHPANDAHHLQFNSVDYTLIIMYIGSSVHTINSTSTDARFSVFVYGVDTNTRTYASYAYPIAATHDQCTA